MMLTYVPLPIGAPVFVNISEFDGSVEGSAEEIARCTYTPYANLFSSIV